MPKKESSPELSAVAAILVSMSDKEMGSIVSGVFGDEPKERFFENVRSLAASVLSQDETKGQAK